MARTAVPDHAITTVLRTFGTPDLPCATDLFVGYDEFDHGASLTLDPALAAIDSPRLFSRFSDVVSVLLE